MLDLGLLILRVVLGLVMAAHGAQKLFGWFSGPGLEKFAGVMEHLNLRPGRLWALVSGLGEFGGGLLLALGLLTPVGAALIIGTMLMAIATVHLAKGFWNTGGGYEYNVIILAAALALGLTGPGAYALDPRPALGLPQTELFSVSLVVVLMGVAGGLLLQEQQAARVTRTQNKADPK
jgi:putative oxidoreductase